MLPDEESDNGQNQDHEGFHRFSCKSSQRARKSLR
jgi:hypothetical protein